MPFIVFLILIGAGIVWFIAKYNSLVILRNQVTNAWKQIDIQLKRRHDLIPNLVNTVRGYMEYEQDTLKKVIDARNAAVSAKSVVESASKEGELTGVLTKFFALMENYPALKANENVTQLQQELTSTENTISNSRGMYNDIATKFNISQQVFPSNFIANLFNFKQAELFEITVQQEREVPVVDLSMKR